jgi:hypothetical protein
MIPSDTPKYNNHPIHDCPYEGVSENRALLCGKRGFLCDRCKEDRADERCQEISIYIEAAIKSLREEAEALVWVIIGLLKEKSEHA